MYTEVMQVWTKCRLPERTYKTCLKMLNWPTIRHTCGHEFIGQVIALGDNYGAHTKGRPALYNTLKVGHKVVAPFTVNCGECQ